jgi:hypothetical protein
MQLFTYAAANTPKTVDPLAHVLVLMACSATKIETTSSVLLHRLYNGPLWQTLRLHRGAIAWSNVFVLPGKYGFTSAGLFSRPYEEKISRQKVDAIIARGLDGLPIDRHGLVTGPTIRADIGRTRDEPFSQIIIAGAGDYRRFFHWLIEAMTADGLIAPGADIAEVQGGIGEQRGQLGHWLRRMNEAPDITSRAA